MDGSKEMGEIMSGTWQGNGGILKEECVNGIEGINSGRW